MLGNFLNFGFIQSKRQKTSDKMNILIVVPWDQEFGGVASVVGNLAKFLKNKGHEAIFLHPGIGNSPKKKLTKWGFPGFELNLRAPFSKTHPLKSLFAFGVFFLPTLFFISKIIRSHKIDIINIHYPIDSFLYFGICRWLLSSKLVVSIHGADLFPLGKRMTRYPWGLRFLLLSSNIVVAPSRAFLADALNVFAYLKNKCFFIHNGIEIGELELSRERDMLKKYDKYLLSIAAQNDKKGIDVLIRAMALFRNLDPDLKLIIVGDGPLRRQHELLAKELALDDRVEFLGWKGRAETINLLHGCEIFVLPSISEPFGIVTIEAMACKKSVVASAVGGIREIIENGKSGLLVEPNDHFALANALVSLFKNPSLRTLLSTEGYSRVLNHFRCKFTGEKYELLFSRLSGIVEQKGFKWR
jgi:glycosyltransferase involved in cell wall biosynthesis